MDSEQKLRLKVGDLFTREELEKAIIVVSDESDDKKLAARLCKEVVTPEVLARIDAATKQENSAQYLSFLLEFCVRYGNNLESTTVPANALVAQKGTETPAAPAENA